MRTSEDQSARTFRTGSPRGYLIGAALIGVAAWTAGEFLGAEHLHPIDRPAMAIIAIATFGGLGVVSLLRASVEGIVLDGERICVREWTGLSRCFPLRQLTRVTWSYRYAAGIWGHYDHGRAWLEFEFFDQDTGHSVAVIDYAGRSRHAVVERLTRELVERAGLSWDSRGDKLEATDLPSAEIIWERRRAPGASHGATQ